jgi:hypothetical protein
MGRKVSIFLQSFWELLTFINGSLRVRGRFIPPQHPVYMFIHCSQSIILLLMKRLMFFIALMLTVVALQAQDPLETRACNRAEAVARQCLHDNGGPNNADLSSSATVSMICDYSNPNPHYFGYTVTVWGAPHCPPNMFCPLYIFLIAVVDVDCSGQVTNVQCGFN